MLKRLIVLSILTFSAVVTAQDVNLYDQFMSECLISESDAQTCHRIVKQQVLSDRRTSGDFLDCIDYGHSPISLEQEANCLREISWQQ